MVLGYSRAIAALFTLDQTLESFLRGHVAAFEALGGAARNSVYDNLRSAVLDRRGAAVQFHPRLLELAGHYHFAPRPCTPGRGNEKFQASYYAPSCTCDTSSGYRRRSRSRLPGWATGSGPVGGSKSIVPLSSARTARSTPWCAKRLAVAGCTSSSSAQGLLALGEALEEHPFETDLVRAVRSGGRA